MKKSIKIAAAVLSAAAVMSSAAIIADAKAATGSGVYQSDSGNKLTGWQVIDGKTYYFTKDGEKLTKNALIGGVRYRFDRDGVCLGKVTGWARAGSKRFYYEDGVKQTGWLHIGTEWYYIDETLGMLRGERKINGVKYTFSKSGEWDCDPAPSTNKRDASDVYRYVVRKMDRDAYGGVYSLDGMTVIWSVDGKAEKIIAEKFPNVGGVIFKEARYTMRELEEVRAYLLDHGDIWTTHWIDEEHNRVEIGVIKTQTEALGAYIATLPDSGIVSVYDRTGAMFKDI